MNARVVYVKNGRRTFVPLFTVNAVYVYVSLSNGVEVRIARREFYVCYVNFLSCTIFCRRIMFFRFCFVLGRKNLLDPACKRVNNVFLINKYFKINRQVTKYLLLRTFIDKQISYVNSKSINC